MKNKQKHFVVKESQTIVVGAIQIIVDTVIGMNYLNTAGGLAY